MSCIHVLADAIWQLFASPSPDSVVHVSRLFNRSGRQSGRNLVRQTHLEKGEILYMSAMITQTVACQGHADC